ncbi:MAG: hypothetical protein ACE5HW_00135 [Candidatus Methanofastidiosia archaeon]
MTFSELVVYGEKNKPGMLGLFFLLVAVPITFFVIFRERISIHATDLAKEVIFLFILIESTGYLGKLVRVFIPINIESIVNKSRKVEVKDIQKEKYVCIEGKIKRIEKPDGWEAKVSLYDQSLLAFEAHTSFSLVPKIYVIDDVRVISHENILTPAFQTEEEVKVTGIIGKNPLKGEYEIIACDIQKI